MSYNPNASYVDLLWGVTIDNIAPAALVNWSKRKGYPINIGIFIQFVTSFIKGGEKKYFNYIVSQVYDSTEI